MTLFDQIGCEFIESAIKEFYGRAFVDPMICHFFMNSNFDHIVEQQVNFATAMLDGPKCYKGLPLATAHARFQIRPPHFGRRQVLMREVLVDLKLDQSLIDQWMDREEKLRPIILKQR